MSSKERCDEFERQARLNLSGPALNREIESLRRYLYKHQDEHLSRFPSIFSAIMAHSLNPSALQDGKRGSDSILLGLLDDCLALPERVITGQQKLKILNKREKELGRNEPISISIHTISSRQVVDVTLEDNSVTVLDDDGNPLTVSCLNDALLRQLDQSLEMNSDEVYVNIDKDGNVLSRKV